MICREGGAGRGGAGRAGLGVRVRRWLARGGGARPRLFAQPRLGRGAAVSLDQQVQLPHLRLLPAVGEGGRSGQSSGAFRLPSLGSAAAGTGKAPGKQPAGGCSDRRPQPGSQHLFHQALGHEAGSTSDHDGLAAQEVAHVDGVAGRGGSGRRGLAGEGTRGGACGTANAGRGHAAGHTSCSAAGSAPAACVADGAETGACRGRRAEAAGDAARWRWRRGRQAGGEAGPATRRWQELGALSSPGCSESMLP